MFHLKVGRIYLSPQATHLDTDIQHCAELTFSVIPKIRHLQAGTGILTCCASVTPYGRTFPTKPYPFGDMDFNHVYRYLSLDYHFQPLH